jgi:hypothetical protein
MLRKALLLYLHRHEPASPAEPLSFVRDIQPILTKAGCNAGVCHAKAITGQRGFRLSVLGFEPEEDYEAIVKQGKGRRVFPPAPEESLLITKGAAIVPHTGGKKLEPGSETIRRWCAGSPRACPMRRKTSRSSTTSLWSRPVRLCRSRPRSSSKSRHATPMAAAAM